jgi:starch-binding outer membrane protein, SusD/RagB family
MNTIRYKKILFYSVFILSLLGMVSCSDYLDKEPATDVDPEAAYENFFNFQGFTEELYNCIPNFEKRDNNDMWNFGEEEHQSTNGTGWVNDGMDKGNFWIIYQHWNKHWLYGTDFDSAGDRWKHYLWQGSWYGIRKANLGLANLDKMSGTQEEKDLIAGQLYFFRAFFHFQLTKWWGGMPYIDRVLPAGEKFTEPRLTYLECADRIAEDFQKAVDLLPIDWDEIAAGDRTNGNNQLRANKTMAMAFLGKTYLYAGSPWMNVGSNGYGTYNADYCKKAANVFGKILQMSQDGQNQYSLVNWEHYSEIYMSNGQAGKMPGSTEAIFRGPDYDDGFGSYSISAQYAAAGILQSRSWSFYPTANYANYFGMANGMPINESSSYKNYFDAGKEGVDSGYDPQYPWKNRDPRFYLVYYFDTERTILNPPSDAVKWTFANLYTYGGPTADPASYRNTSSGSTTGYLLKKFLPLGFNRYDSKFNYLRIHIPWIRLGDVYLMYAEAVDNGFGSPSASSETNPLTALEAVNVIRDRALVGHFAAKYSVGAGIDSPFMTELIRERAVELAWEGHRFHDLRRWRLLDKFPYTIKTKIEFDRAEPVNFNKVDATANKVLNLREEVIVERQFTERNYWMPIKKDDTTLYLEFPQNPGW